MTRQEYFQIMDILDALKQKEDKYCARYCELNPADVRRRTHDANLYKGALEEVRHNIRYHFANDIVKWEAR